MSQWYVTTRDTRYAERGRPSTSDRTASQVADRTLRVRKATPEEIRNRKRDSQRQVPYKVLVEKGRVVL
jgi:hypothetical protein